MLIRVLRNQKQTARCSKISEELEGVTLNDLYEQYPDFNIDIEREKELLLAHQVIIWHHPLYMYSAPPLLKQWIDLVLEHGWAHGEGGNFLKNKIIFNAVTAGGTREVLCRRRFNSFTMRVNFSRLLSRRQLYVK